MLSLETTMPCTGLENVVDPSPSVSRTTGAAPRPPRAGPAPESVDGRELPQHRYSKLVSKCD